MEILGQQRRHPLRAADPAAGALAELVLRLFSTLRRHSPDANASILDDNGRPGFQRFWGLGNRRPEPFAQIILTRQCEPQQNDPRRRGAGQARDLAEIQIKSHNDPRVFGGSYEDVAVR